MGVESATDRAAFVADFGQTAVWTKSDASTAALTVLIQTKHDLSSGFELNGTELQTTDYIIEAPSSDLGGVKPTETITTGGVVYAIVAVMEDGMGWTELLAEKL